MKSTLSYYWRMINEYLMSCHNVFHLYLEIQLDHVRVSLVAELVGRMECHPLELKIQTAQSQVPDVIPALGTRIQSFHKSLSIGSDED